jgi:hypothetical protein
MNDYMVQKPRTLSSTNHFYSFKNKSCLSFPCTRWSHLFSGSLNKHKNHNLSNTLKSIDNPFHIHTPS